MLHAESIIPAKYLYVGVLWLYLILWISKSFRENWPSATVKKLSLFSLHSEVVFLLDEWEDINVLLVVFTKVLFLSPEAPLCFKA